MFVRAEDACRYGRVWLAMWKAKTWRDFLNEIPMEYQDKFVGLFDSDAELDQPLDPHEMMSGYDGTFPPGFPRSHVGWMPKEIIERFAKKWGADLEIESKHAEEILGILRREGFESISAPDLVNMMAFCNPRNIDGIEKLISATEREMGVPKQEKRGTIRIDSEKGSFYRESRG